MPVVMAFDRYGPAEVLGPHEIPVPQPGPGQVRVRVRAAGVQPFDCDVRAGKYAPWMRLTLPSGVGNEFAGVVDATGAGVTSVQPQDAVIGWEQMRCYAEVIVVPADQVVRKPPELSWSEAGVLSASGQTAHTAVEDLRIAPGETLLVHAAAGGVGSFAVQIARALGATVIGTAGRHNHDYLRSLGAIPVTYQENLEEQVRVAAPQGVDAALDCVGGTALEVSTRLVADRSRIGTVADRMGAGRLGVLSIGTRRSPDRLRELLDLHRRGLLRISIWKEFDLRDAAAAQREVETGHVRGKVVLTVPDHDGAPA